MQLWRLAVRTSTIVDIGRLKVKTRKVLVSFASSVASGATALGHPRAADVCMYVFMRS